MNKKKKLDKMENEKKYKELVGKIKKAYLYTQTESTKAVLEDILPSLKESEDDKIRKEIISALKFANNKGVYNKHLAWLEKQGKQELNDDDEEKFRDVIRLIEQAAPVQSIREHYTNWFKSLKERIGG